MSERVSLFLPSKMIHERVPGPDLVKPRNRKKVSLNGLQQFAALARNFRASLAFDSSSTPQSPVMLSYATVLSPPVEGIEMDFTPKAATPPRSPLDRPQDWGSTGSLVRPDYLYPRRNSCAVPKSPFEGNLSTYATLRKPATRRKAVSEELPRRSWELEDWQLETRKISQLKTTSAIIIPSSRSSPVASPTPSTETPIGWSTMEGIVDGLNLGKTDRKINKINIHQHALFLAVQNGQLDKARNIINNNALDINSVNSEGISLLEVAVMNHNLDLVKLLQKNGATETYNKSYSEQLLQLERLVRTAESRQEELVRRAAHGPSKDLEKQRELWTRQCNVLTKMKSGLEKLQAPGPPSTARVEVIDSTRVRVSFAEPAPSPAGITTKFKVEWTVDEWENVCNSLELTDLRRTSAVIERLAQGRRHHFRVSAGNMKDYGPPLLTTPLSVVPSGWRDLDARKPRFEGLLREFDNLFNQVRNARPEHASEIRAIEPGQETPLNQRRTQKKKTIMQLFTPAPKFHKNLKRGCFLSCILWCDNKVLVTAEDFLPVVEVDENFPSQAKQDLKWLMEVATTWDDVKSLKQDMERAGSVSYLPFRSKLLQAAANMQTALGIQDLGQFYHDSIKDSHGSLVFCTVRHIRSPKAVSAMNVRWVPINKLKERKLSSISPSSTPGEPPAPTAGELLIQSISQQIEYDRNSRHPLPRGLYLGYLKLQSSMEQLRVLVPHERPNMFPNIKIRDNTHVSREEWEWVQQLVADGDACPSPAQKEWQSQLCSAAQKLTKQLGVTGEHRIYSGEVLDLSGDVSLILLLPSSDALFCNPGQEDALLNKPELLALPLHTFEMVHMSTYQSQLLGRYARLNCILEMDKLVAEHAKREAFSQTEISTTKTRLTQVRSFQETLEEAWKQLRWVKDAIGFARDKTNMGVPLSLIVASATANFTATRSHQSSFSSHRLSDTSSPPSSPPFLPHLLHSSNDSINIGADKKRLCKKEDRSHAGNISRGMKKSSTAENVRVTPKVETNFVKSKTSECLYHSNSYDSCNDSPSINDFSINNNDKNNHKNTVASSWVSGRPNDSQIYRKDLAVTRSEYHLQDPMAPKLPLPRKASAPPCLDARNASPQKQTSSSESKSPINDSISLESIADTNLSRRRKESVLESRESAIKIVGCVKSPSSSFYDLHQPYNASISVEMQRTGSSLSHESDASFSSMTASLKSLSSTETEADTVSLLSRESGRSETSETTRSSVDGDDPEGPRRGSEETAIRQVFAAYETGLSSRVSVKLQVSNKTTAREVIDLVVRRLNMTVVEKGKKGPTYGNEKLRNFCLVAVINKRERCLRDDFRLLSLQDPWRQGRLYVRFIADKLAAIEQSTARQGGQASQPGTSAPPRQNSLEQQGSSGALHGSSQPSGDQLLTPPQHQSPEPPLCSEEAME